jgi:quinol monooxygenase YgiN
MHIVLVHIEVKPEMLAVFLAETRENAANSLREPGITRFDVLQQQDDPNRIVLVEVYRQPEDQEKHRQTHHYLRWRDAVKDMMAAERVGTRYTNLMPADEGWE